MPEHIEIIQKFLDELQAAPLRKVRFKSPFKVAYYWIWTIVILGISLFMAWLQFCASAPILARSFGSSRPATVIRKYTQPIYTQTHVHLMGIRVKCGDYEEDFNIYPSLYDSLVEGQVITAYCFCWLPQWFSIDGDPFVGNWVIVIFLGLIYYGLSVFLIVRLGIRLYKQKYLLTHGVVVLGRIDNVSDIGAFNRGVPNPKPTMVTYNFELNQRLYRGQTLKYNYMDCSLQDEVVILADPQNPKYSMAYDHDHWFWEPA